MQVGLLVAGGVLVGWEFQQHRMQGRELASVQAQVQGRKQELDFRRRVLDALEQRDRELQETERRAGNQTLLSLLRERNAATLAAQSNAATHTIGSALAKVLVSPKHREADREYLRSDLRANLDQFFKLLNLPPDRINQYIDLQVEMESRKADRLSALLEGRMTVADALSERDKDATEWEQRRHDVLGDDGFAFYNGIADAMRTDEAKRLLGIIQQNMGGNTLGQDQGDRLQGLIKTEIVTISPDDVDLFRPPQEWTQIYLQRQQNVLAAAADFLTPDQLDTLKALGEYGLAERQRQMMARRTSLGIK